MKKNYFRTLIILALLFTVHPSKSYAGFWDDVGDFFSSMFSGDGMTAYNKDEDYDGDGFYGDYDGNDDCSKDTKKDLPCDCDDSNANINPDILEICSDGIDNNCDGTTDETDCVVNDEETNSALNLYLMFYYTDTATETWLDSTNTVDAYQLTPNTFYIFKMVCGDDDGDISNVKYGKRAYSTDGIHTSNTLDITKTDESDYALFSFIAPDEDLEGEYHFYCYKDGDRANTLTSITWKYSVKKETSIVLNKGIMSDEIFTPLPYSASTSADSTSPDDDGDGYTVDDGDCDDADNDIYPGADEICDDSADNNCDGTTDESDCIALDSGSEETTVDDSADGSDTGDAIDSGDEDASTTATASGTSGGGCSMTDQRQGNNLDFIGLGILLGLFWVLSRYARTALHS